MTVAILNQSESVEWYTPARYVEAVRVVFGGGIDLDKIIHLTKEVSSE